MLHRVMVKPTQKGKDEVWCLVQADGGSIAHFHMVQIPCSRVAIRAIHIMLYLLQVNDAVSNSGYTVSKDWIMNWKGCGRKQTWPNFRYYPSICLD
jgi:hypothetical protein